MLETETNRPVGFLLTLLLILLATPSLSDAGPTFSDRTFPADRPNPADLSARSAPVPSALPGEPDTLTVLPANTVLDREDLIRAGVSRPHELFQLLEGWDGYSINGQDWHGTPAGLSFYETASWVLLVDDHPVPIELPGWHSFNHLPVGISQIEQVVAVEAPGIYQGRFARHGLIHIRTREQQEGWSLQSRMMAGNEINDPGPYEFTDLNSPNEERLGPDIDLTTGYRKGPWHFRAGGTLMRHRSTDTPIEQRIKQMLFLGDAEFGEPTNLKRSLYLRSGFDTHRTRLSLQAGGTNHRDFLFLRPYGREIPAMFQSRFAGLHLERQLTGSIRAVASASRRRAGSEPVANRMDADPAFASTKDEVRAALSRETPERVLTAGGSFRRLGADVAPEGTFSLRSGTLFGVWSERIGRGRVSGELELLRGEGEWYGSWSLRSGWRLTERQRIELWVSEGRTPEWERRDYWFWRGRGYGGVTGLDVESDPLPRRGAERHNSIGLEWSRSLPGTAREGKITLRSTVHKDQNLFLSRQQFELVRPEQWFIHDGVSFNPDEKVTSLRLTGRLEFSSLPGLRHTVTGAIRPLLRGSPEAVEAASQLPRSRLSLLSDWTPVRGFTLFGHLRLMPSVSWREFERIDGESYHDQQQLDEGVYRSRTPAFSLIDLGGRKSLWQGRLALDLIVKNVLNQPYLLHPVGADHELTFYVQLELTL